MLVARTFAAALPPIAIAVSASTVAASAPMLFAFALRARGVSLAFGGKLMELGGLATGRRRLLLRTRLLSLLRRALLPAFIPSIRARAPIRTTLLALTLSVALLLLAITPAALLEATVLLAVAAAAAFAAIIAPAIPALIVPLAAVTPLLLIAAMVALLLRLRLDRCGCGSGRCGRGRLEEAEQP